MTTHIVFTFDVSSLDTDELEALAVEVIVQHESSETHPTVPLPTVEWVD